jgi:beta-galactosidase
MTQPLLGVDYYPEHWPPERWDIDARQMQEIGLSVVRLAEFAWTKLEPEEGEYAWGWLDDVLERLAAAGLQIVLSTPTAAPPAWLIQKYPDILPMDDQGRRRQFGGRRHYCFHHPAYQEYSRRIVAEMARHYGQHTAVIGWQLDNEFGCHQTARCYCDLSVAAFREWLRKKYGILDALNAAWGTVFWNQIYSDWNQIVSPSRTPTDPNPCQSLDWYRFSSDSITTFAQNQIDILREICPQQRITTNFLGTSLDFNHYRVSAPLDFISYDSYPTGYTETTASSLYMPDDPRPAVAYDAGDPYAIGFCHDLMRGLKPGTPFWVMEQQAGHINWGRVNPGVRPGSVRLWTWHDLAAGADAVVFFTWRACRFAQEQYHSGLLRHDAVPDTGFEELRRMKVEQPMMRSLQGTRTQADVAILADYDALWATDLQPHNHLCTYWRHLFGYYRPLARAGVPTDILPIDEDLSSYKLVIAPNMILADETLAEHLADYVKRGGLLLLGARAGFKTPSNLVTDQPLPGVFRDMVGATVESFHSLPPGIGYPLKKSKIPAREAIHWAEGLSLQSAQALFVYEGGPLAGLAAVTERQLGTGRVVYAGLWPSAAAAAGLTGWLLDQAKVAPVSDLPEGVCVCRRGRYVFLFNYREESCTVRLDIDDMVNAFNGKKAGKKVKILGRDVMILKTV